MHPNRLSAADQAAEVLRVLHPIERQDEGGLTMTDRTGEDLLRGNLWAASNHQRNALMPVKPGELADQRPLNFDDGDAQRGGVQHHLLQCGAALWHHEELDCLTSRGECLFNWMTPGNQLLVRTNKCERLRRNGALRCPVPRTIGSRRPTARSRRAWADARSRRLARGWSWSLSWRSTLFVHY